MLALLSSLALTIALRGQAEVEANASDDPMPQLVPVERNEKALTPFERAELRRLSLLDLRELTRRPIRGVLGYEQEYWRNPASVHVIRPDDLSLNGHVITAEAFRAVPGMYVTRGVGFDDYVVMRNFSGSVEKFLGMVDGRDAHQPMTGSINFTTADVPLEILDRVEIIRGPGASIWGTNAVSGVLNVVTKSAADTQGDSLRMVIRDDGTFLGDYVHGGELSEDTHYRVWLRGQEFAEGELESGVDARDDGYNRKGGFRLDKYLPGDIEFTLAGAYAERRVERSLDLSQRLFYSTDGTAANTMPLSMAIGLGLPGAAYPSSWLSNVEMSPTSTVVSSPFVRSDFPAEVINRAGHLRTKLAGVTNSDMEWSLAGYVEHYDTFLGHAGMDWERDQYEVDFRANRPFGERHHLAFGLAARRMELAVKEEVYPPWADFSLPLTNYGSSPTAFDRYTGYLQDTYEIDDETLLSLGSKFEESDLVGSNAQPGVRLSRVVNDSNVFWAAYSRAYRTSSLVQRYVGINAVQTYVANFGVWSNTVFPGESSHEKEVTDAYEAGWRSQPRDDLILELSLFHYDSKNSVDFTPPSWTVTEAETTGGEITFDYAATPFWTLKGGVFHAFAERGGEEDHGFPDTIANLSSHLKARDDLVFTQNLYYASDRFVSRGALSDYSIPEHLRLDLGVVWRPDETLEIGLFGRDLLDPHHPETMLGGVDVEPGRVDRTFLLSLTKRF